MKFNVQFHTDFVSVILVLAVHNPKRRTSEKIGKWDSGVVNGGH